MEAGAVAGGLSGCSSIRVSDLNSMGEAEVQKPRGSCCQRLKRL